MRKIISSLLIVLLFIGNIHISFGNSQNIRDNNDDYVILNNDEKISYFLNIKDNFTRSWKYNEEKVTGKCNLKEYKDLMKKVGEEIMYKSNTEVKIIKDLRDLREDINVLNVTFGLDGKKYTQEEKIKIISEYIGKVISKLIFSKLSEKEKEDYIGLLYPWISEVVSESFQNNKGIKDFSNETVGNLILGVISKVLLGGMENIDTNSYEHYSNIVITFISYVNGTTGVFLEELEFGRKCVNDIFKSSKNIKEYEDYDYKETVFLQANLSSKYLLSNLYGINPKENTSDPTGYYLKKLKECPNNYVSMNKRNDGGSYYDKLKNWIYFDDITYEEYLVKYCGINLNIDNVSDFKKHTFSKIELNYIAQNNIKNYLQIISYEPSEKNISYFLLTKLSHNVEYNYTNPKYIDLVKNNTIEIEKFLSKKETERLVDTNCDYITETLKKNYCINILTNGTLFDKIKYIKSNSGVLNISKKEIIQVEEKGGFLNWVTNIYDGIVSGIKNIFDGNDKKTTTKVEPISIGNHITPNGKEFEIINNGDNFSYKDSDLKESKKYSTIQDIQKELNINNPLISEDFNDVSGKKYKITNYKGTTIYDEKGSKIDKNFTSKDEAINYIKELNSPSCDITIKRLIRDFELSNLGNKDENKKFVGNYRIINFKNLNKCKSGKLNFNNFDTYGGEIPGINGVIYSFLDMLTFVGGFGGYDNEEPIKTDSIKIENQNGLNGKISINEYKGGKYYIFLNISDINISLGTFVKPKKISKPELDTVIGELTLIGKTFNVYSETPPFDWSNIDKNSSRFLSCISNLSTDEFISKFGSDNENGFYAIGNNGLEKIIYIKGNDKFKDCCRMGIECSLSGYNKTNNSLIINRTAFDNMTQTLLSDENYFINVNNGNVTLKK